MTNRKHLDTSTELAPELVTLVQQWAHVKAQVQAAQEAERDLREQVKAAVFADAGEKGTFRKHVAGGVAIKFVAGVRRTFDDLDKADAVLDRMQNSGPEGALMAQRLVRVKYELSETEFNKLPTSWRAEVEDVLTTKASAPTLEIEYPK